MGGTLFIHPEFLKGGWYILEWSQVVRGGRVKNNGSVISAKKKDCVRGGAMQ